jgi:hypothetical protein
VEALLLKSIFRGLPGDQRSIMHESIILFFTILLANVVNHDCNGTGEFCCAESKRTIRDVGGVVSKKMSHLCSVHAVGIAAQERT